MALKYYHAINTGKGFITHTDNEFFFIKSHPGDIWTTENTTWATRVGAIEKTFSEAQALVSSSLDGSNFPSGSRAFQDRTYSLPQI